MLCVKFAPRLSVETAVCDIQILGRSKNTPNNFTFIGELNSVSIWYRSGAVPQTPGLSLASMSLQPPEPPRRVTPTPVAPTPVYATVTRTRPDYEQQNSGGIYTISAMDGIPFTISEKFVNRRPDVQPVSVMGISIKSAAEIEEEYHYTFNTEFSINS
ncbi:multivesicular body subunit 12B-like [Sardina pilchardus]|uniref:multivesicular body subunit 12B-like n=1 Tax=Sardina pilchardus TaxID=27697 RepID=UPI002E0D366C